MRRRQIAPAAQRIAKEGVSVTLSGPRGMIASIGAVTPNLLGRLLTGSRHVRLGRLNVVREARKSGLAGPRIEIPPMTLFPLVPTVNRRIHRRPTTTHYLPGSGRPRLIFVVGSDTWDGRPPREFDLLDGTTRIGSSTEADLRLDGLDAVHAEIVHDANDDYVLRMRSSNEEYIPVLEDPSSTKAQGRILRTGARIELGPWRMAFFREEFADHGRPYGGRAGGELAHQKRQPGPRGERT